MGVGKGKTNFKHTWHSWPPPLCLEWPPANWPTGLHSWVLQKNSHRLTFSLWQHITLKIKPLSCLGSVRDTCLISNPTGPVVLTRAQCCSTGPRERMISERAGSVGSPLSDHLPTAPDDPTQHTPLKWSDQNPHGFPRRRNRWLSVGHFPLCTQRRHRTLF